MKKRKLIYRFHNPNPDKVMETYIQQMMIHNGVDQVFRILTECREQEYEREGGTKNEHCSVLPCVDR